MGWLLGIFGISSEVDGLSCSEAAAKLSLSGAATLALRVGLMLLRLSMKSVEARYQLGLTLSPKRVTIRVSRTRLSDSIPTGKRKKSSETSDAPVSSSTETIENSTVVPPEVALFLTELPESPSQHGLA